MPSPIAHISVGYAVYRFLKERTDWGGSELLARWDAGSIWFKLLLFAGCACFSLVPDMDAAPAVVFGELRSFHNHYTHSIFFVLVFSLLAGAVVKALFRTRFGFAFFVVLVCASLHVVMDLFCQGRGQMLFWPLDDYRVRLPFRLFYGLQWSEGWWSVHHLWTALSEGLFAACVVFSSIKILRKRT